MITEVGAHGNEDCPHGLLQWAAQPDFETGKGVGRVLSPTRREA